MRRVRARTAKASEFDKAAQDAANGFWIWLLVAAALWWFGFSAWFWGAAIGLAGFDVLRSIGATIAARQLRAGTYRLPNPNNGMDI